jgi:hypothetical protein
MNIMNMNIGHIHIRNIHEYSHYSYFISIAISVSSCFPRMSRVV